MKYFEDLVSLKYYGEKIWLPHNKEEKLKGTAVYSINNSKESLAKIFLNEHSRLTNNGNLYRVYFYNPKYIPTCVVSKKIKRTGVTFAMAKKDRLSKYSEMTDLCDSLKTPIQLASQSGRNVIYDLQPIVDIIQTQKRLKNSMLVDKLHAFFDSVFTMISKPLDKNCNNYKKACILVDLDDYKKCKDKTWHILYNLVMLLKRSDKIISQFTNYDTVILFFSESGCFTFNFKTDLSRNKLNDIKRLLKRLHIDIDPDIEDGEKKEIQNYMITKGMTNKMTGDGEDILDMNIDPDDILDKDGDVVTAVKGKIKDIEDLDDEVEMSSVEDEIFADEELKNEYVTAIQKPTVGEKNTKSAANLKRDEMLREKQKKIKVKGKTIEEIISTESSKPIEVHEIKSPTITNENLKEMKFPNFRSTYMETAYQKDIVNTFNCLEDKSIPVHVLDVKVEDTSDKMNLKETYTVTLEDENRQRHTLKFALPKFIDNKFMYLNGNKKVLATQNFPYPVIKTGPDEVKISTNYRRVFLYRIGTKFSRNTEKMRKLLDEPGIVKNIKTGNNVEVNKGFLTCLEYDEYAKQYTTFDIGNARFVFNAEKLEEIFDGKEKSDLNKILIGYTIDKKEPIYYKKDDTTIDDMTSLMVSYASAEAIEKFKEYSTGKKYVYTSAKIMTKMIPVVVLLCSFEGLSTVIRKFDDKTVEFTDKKSNQDNYMYIKFADGYLRYPMSNMEACMLFNGFTEIPTGDYTIEDMDDKNTYLEIYEYMFGSAYIVGALANFYDFLIDPITLEILETLNYPTDVVSLFIFANNMLADNKFESDIDFGQFRLRNNEVIPAILYKEIIAAYSRYRQTANNPHPKKISMDENAVLKDIMSLCTVEDYSTLSPMVELHKDGLVSMKGDGGMNKDRAYKADKRAYDDSMIGVIGISTDPGPNCGKIRQLVAEPTVVNTRGFMDLKRMEGVDKLKDAQLSTPVEMLTPLSATHDNSTRTAMATKQTGHSIPVEDNCPMLVSTGMDQICHYRTSNDFSVVAKDDGEVVEYNEKNNLIIIKYKNGEHQAIDLAPHVVKNGGGGFFLANKLTPKVTAKQKFKKDDILAYDPKYYKDFGPMGNRLTMGTLLKVAVMSHFATYEDSTFVTKQMSRRMATNITMQKSVIIGANASVDYIVKVGDAITVGDPLIKYETSYDDDELNRMLSGVRDDMKEEIVNLGKTAITSSYTGFIEDIVIYSTVDNDQLSPSLQKIVKAYQSNINERTKVLDKYDKESHNSVYRMGALMDKTGEKIIPNEYGKVKGEDLGDGVKIEFYITYHDELSDGDKLAQSTANKNTIGYVIPEGYEAFSEMRPYEEISTPVAPSAILQRGTPSVILTGTTYKVLIELGRKMYEILTGENYDEVLKKKNPYMVRDQKTVSESTIDILTESEVATLEDVFELYPTEEGYVGGKIIDANSMIVPLNETKDNSPLLEKFQYSDTDYNAVIMDNTITATSLIFPETPIVIKK